MNKLRKRMIGDIQLRGFADRIVEVYGGTALRPAHHFTRRSVGIV